MKIYRIEHIGEYERTTDIEIDANIINELEFAREILEIGKYAISDDE